MTDSWCDVIYIVTANVTTVTSNEGAASGISVGAVVASTSTHESCRGAEKPKKRSHLYKNMKLTDVKA